MTIDPDHPAAAHALESAPAQRAEMRLAATIALLRDGPEGMEVFMMQRHARADFGGLHVFPGGKVDPADAHGAMAQHCLGLTDSEASAQLGIEMDGLAFWVAAIRECFEEAGVLLGYGPDGKLLRASKPRWAAGLSRLRDDLNAGHRDFLSVCTETGLQLATDRVHYFSHWITPEGRPRRYDTRFFLVAAPDQQQGLHDDGELVDSAWIRPADALDAQARGDWQMIHPTFITLRALTQWQDVAGALAAVSRCEHLPLVTPDERLAAEGMQPPPAARS